MGLVNGHRGCVEANRQTTEWNGDTFDAHFTTEVNLILKSGLSEDFSSFSDVCFYFFMYCLVTSHEVPTAKDTSCRELGMMSNSWNST